MTFSKGQIVNVRFWGAKTSNREFKGEFEIIRTGARFYLFSNVYGYDWNPTKSELIQAIEEYKK